MRTWDEFIPNMVSQVPGCPEFEIVNKLRDAAIEFCTRSRIWRTTEPIELGTTVADQRQYNVVNNPTLGGLNWIHAAWIGDEEIAVALPGDDLDSYPGQRSDTPLRTYGMQPQSYTNRFKIGLTGRASFQLVPAPAVAGEIVKAMVSYVPFEDAAGLPDFIYREYREAIERRALADLMVQVGKPWTNLALVGPMVNRFESLLMEAAEVAGPVRRPGQGIRVQKWG